MKTVPFRLRFEVQSDFAYLPFLTSLFHRLPFFKAKGLTQILVELFNNAIVHGHRKKKELWIGIELISTSQKIILRVLDRGRGLPVLLPKQAASPWQTHGRGLTLIKAHAHKVKSLKKQGLHVMETTLYVQRKS